MDCAYFTAPRGLHGFGPFGSSCDITTTHTTMILLLLLLPLELLLLLSVTTTTVLGNSVIHHQFHIRRLPLPDLRVSSAYGSHPGTTLTTRLGTSELITHFSCPEQPEHIHADTAHTLRTVSYTHLTLPTIYSV